MSFDQNCLTQHKDNWWVFVYTVMGKIDFHKTLLFFFLLYVNQLLSQEGFCFMDFVKHYLVNLLKPTGYVMHQQFNIQQLYALPTLNLCVLYLSENKQQLVLLTT